MRSVATALPALGLLLGYTMLEEQCPVGDDDTTPPASTLRVGSAIVTLMPEVDGSTAYFEPIREGGPLAMAPGDPGDDPGLFIDQWDVGTLPIGNGSSSSHWAHDEIRGGAIAFQDSDDPQGKILVLVTADVYMLFRQDIQGIYDKVRLRVGPDAFERLTIIVSATHNHMGPDTAGLSGDMNGDYFEYMTSQLASAVVQAIDETTLEPAHLQLSADRYQFGLNDGNAPYVLDSSLHALQAVSAVDGRILATVFQWSNHPEATLGYGKNIYATDEQADYLKSIDECFLADDGQHCHVEGQFISAGFPGYAAWHIMEQTGAPALFFNGNVGQMMTPLSATVWETEGPDGVPAGDGTAIPSQAAFLSKSFHKEAVIGLELGRRVLEDLSLGERVTEGLTVSAVQTSFYSRLTNLGFRFGLSVTPTGNPMFIGYEPREMFTCPATGEKNDATCVSDDYQSNAEPVLGLPVRVGDHMKIEAHYLRVGPVGFLTIPGEAVSEIVEGLPYDFATNPYPYYGNPEDQASHAYGSAYDTPGYARQMLPDRYKWVLGLTQDEGGYMLPLSNWRIMCVADSTELGGREGLCAELYSAGIMDFEDYDHRGYAISGQRCKDITEHPELLEAEPYILHPDGATFAQYTCTYGQTFGEAFGHYEETMSAGWDTAADWMNAVQQMLGYSSPLEDINPDFVSINVR